MNTFKYLIPLITSFILVGCGSSVTAVAPEPNKAKMPDAMTPMDKTKPLTVDPSIVLTLSFTATKAFHFEWDAVPGATSYNIQEDINSDGDYQDITTTSATATSFDHIVPIYARVNARYVLYSCIEDVCTPSAVVHTSSRLADMTSSIGYIKASNTEAGDEFGSGVSLSGDGTTLAVGALNEDRSGAVYVFVRNGAHWSEQAKLKATIAEEFDKFGHSVSLSDDGDTLAVGAYHEDSDNSSGATDNSATKSGAVYVFTRNSVKKWSQQSYLKASNAGMDDSFGIDLSISGDGNTLAVGAIAEGGSATGVQGSGTDETNGALSSGAVYIFNLLDAGWTQKAYLKASNSGAGDEFGGSVSLSKDGNTLAVGAIDEDSDATGNNERQENSGAVYVFSRSGEADEAAWSAPAYLKASNAYTYNYFGNSVSLSADGNTLVVSAWGERSPSKQINTGQDLNNQTNGFNYVGAVYVFTLSSGDWLEQSYIKASNSLSAGYFGVSTSISADGNTLAVGAWGENSNATGVNGNKTNDEAEQSGAVYTYVRSNGTWSEQAYLKASNTEAGDKFGTKLALSSDGATLVVGSRLEKSNAIGINGDQTNNAASSAGAVYVY